MADTPKQIKRLLREYAAAAHEEDLRRALLPVAEAFKRRERREVDSGELAEIVLEMVVAFAITTGVLSRDSIPAELLDHLAGAMRFYEEEQVTS